MSEPDFNLLDEPWIPVLMTDGRVQSLGIREVFRQAADIADLACELPTQKIAIQRILLAICYRTLPVRNERDWKNLWISGLPLEPIEAYLDEWRDRFYLFGGRHPFMQAPDLRTAKGTVSGLEKLIADVPNGEPFFTTRHGKAIRKISASEAAVWLVHAQAFDASGIRSGAVDDPEVSGGKGYPIGPAWAGHLGLVWLRGQNLDETLVLNRIVEGQGELKAPLSIEDRGACTWEDAEVETGARRDFSLEGCPDPQVLTVSRLLTWHSRRIRLVGDREGVTGVVLCLGDKLSPQNMHAHEPMSLWRYSKPQSQKLKRTVYMPQKHEQGRAFWRTLPAVLPILRTVDGADKQKHPAFLQSATLEFHHGIAPDELPEQYPRRIRVEAVGAIYGAQEAVIDDVYHDQVSLASVLLRERGGILASMVDQQIRATEDVARALGSFAANLARASGERGDGAGDGARDKARAQFFSMVDDPFRRWLAIVDEDGAVDEHVDSWRRQVRGIALKVVDDLTRRAPRTAVIGRETQLGYMNLGKAENFFRKALDECVPMPATEQKGDNR